MLSALATGDLSQRIAAEYFGTFGQLKQDAMSGQAQQLQSLIGFFSSSRKRGTESRHGLTQKRSVSTAPTALFN